MGIDTVLKSDICCLLDALEDTAASAMVGSVIDREMIAFQRGYASAINAVRTAIDCPEARKEAARHSEGAGRVVEHGPGERPARADSRERDNTPRSYGGTRR